MKNSKKQIIKTRLGGNENLAKILELENQISEKDDKADQILNSVENINNKVDQIKEIKKKIEDLELSSNDIENKVSDIEKSVNEKKEDKKNPEKDKIQEVNVKNIGDLNNKEIPFQFKDFSFKKIKEGLKSIKEAIGDILKVNVQNEYLKVLFVKKKKNGDIVELDPEDIFKAPTMLGGGGPSSVGIKDVSNNRINPATEETSQAIETLMNDVKLNQANGSQKTNVINEFHLDMAMGLIPGMKHVDIFGRNPDVDVADGFETVWNGGGVYTGQNATNAQIVQIFSSDVNDTLLGTGAQTVRFYGLNGSGVETSEIVSLNGTTPVDTVNTYKRFIKMTVISSGSGGKNAGTLTSRQKVTTENVFCVMPIGMNHTAVGAYTIPAGKTGYLKCWEGLLAGKSGTANSEFRLMIRQPGESWQTEGTGSAKSAGSSAYSRIFNYYKDEPLLEGCDIRIDGDTDTNNTILACNFCLVLVDN